MTSTLIDPSNAADVRTALAAYLRGRNLRFEGFSEDPTPIGRGFDTFIYAFRIAAANGDPAWSERLVARIYSAPDRAPTAHHEALVQQFAASRGYPALVPLAVEGSGCALGLPLMLMPFVEGGSALDVIKHNLLRIGNVLAAVGEMHARLHALPLDDCPLSYDGAFVEAQLCAARAYVERVAPGQFEDELRWLEAHRDRASDAAPSLLHNDFHPLNVLIGPDGAMTVIDWTDAMSGDRHSDLGRTLVLLWAAKIAATDRLERLTLRLLRGFMRRRHLTGYQRRLQVDRVRLHYWEVFHTLKACAQLVELRTADPTRLTDMAKSLDPRLIDEARRHLSGLIASSP